MNEILTGKIVSSVQLQGSMTESENLAGKLSRDLPSRWYDGQTTIDPTKSSQTLPTYGLMLLSDITVNSIPDEYIIPSGELEITENDDYDVTQYASVDVNVPQGAQNPQAKSVTISSAGTLEIEPDVGYDALSKVTTTTPSATIIQGRYEGFQTDSGQRTFHVRGYYNPTSAGWVAANGEVLGIDGVFDAIPTGTSVTPTTSSQSIGGAKTVLESAVTVNPIPPQYIVPSGTKNITSSGTEDVTEYENVNVPSATSKASFHSNFANSGTIWQVTPKTEVTSAGWVTVGDKISPTTTYSAVPSGSTVTPTTSSQTVGGANYMMEDAVTINPIPSQYIIPSGTKSITTNGVEDVTNYANVDVNVPQGSANLESGSATISASGTVTHSPSVGYDGFDTFTTTTPSGSVSASATVDISLDDANAVVTPSATVSAGFLSSGTTTGSEIIIDAMDLVEGNTITADQSGVWNVYDKETITIPDAGIVGYGGYVIGTPTISVDANGLVESSYINYLDHQVYPIYTDGWAKTTDYTNVHAEVVGDYQLTTQGSQTLYPSTSDQTIANGRYLTGTQTFKAVTTTNLTAENIKSGVTVSVGDSANASRVKSVTGTYSGGGGGMNKQAYIGQAQRTANSYGATTVTLTVAVTGTYKVSWTAWRSSSSGTMGTNLHVNNTTGTNQQTFTGTYGQRVELTNQHYNANDVLTLYATSGSTTRSIYVANLIIEQTG